MNQELVLLYWQLGHDILTRQEKQGWGAKVIDRLASDLKAAFLDDPALREDDNLVHARQRGEPVRDADDSALLGELVNGRLHLCLGL